MKSKAKLAVAPVDPFSIYVGVQTSRDRFPVLLKDWFKFTCAIQAELIEALQANPDKDALIRLGQSRFEKLAFYCLPGN